MTPSSSWSTWLVIRSTSSGWTRSVTREPSRVATEYPRTRSIEGVANATSRSASTTMMMSHALSIKERNRAEFNACAS